MATLQGQQPKDTYKGLIKSSDEQAITSEKSLEDGDGNSLPMTISPTAVGFSGDVKDGNGSTGSIGQVITSTASGIEWRSRTFTFNQTVSTAVWNIQHDLFAFPSVSIIDSVGNFVVGDVSYTDSRNITITFKTAFKGTAYLN
jgi:hypothetical protein